MTAIDDAFKAFVSTAIATHFADAPKPDGTTETNREHIRRKGAVCNEIEKMLDAAVEFTDEERLERCHYAEEQAQGAIYDLFPKLERKPRRYK